MKIVSSRKFSDLIIQTQENQTLIKNLKAKVQYLNDSILYYNEQTQNYRGTTYTTYEEQTTVANAMYNGTADWGVDQLGALVQARVSFIMPKGFSLVPLTEDAEPEITFLNDFIKFNSLQKEFIYQLVAEGELDAKVLLKLFYDRKTPYIPEGEINPITGMPSVRYISNTSYPYKIETDKNDYMMITKAVYKANGNEETILQPEMVYRKFGGRLNNVNQASSKILKIISQIENLDKALRDWREINKLFASPIPHAQVSTPKEAEDSQTIFDKSNWKPGQMIFTPGSVSYIQPTMVGAEMIYKEIVVLAEMIAFNTGVPVHFWFPELATNRATAEDISYGLINSATSSERNIWEGLLEELFNKAIYMRNKNTNLTPLREGLISVHIPVVTKDDWKQYMDVWVKLRQNKMITQKTMLSKSPEPIDINEEIKNLEEEKMEAFNAMKESGMFQNNDEEDQEEQ